MIVTTDGCSFRATMGTCANEFITADESSLDVVLVAWGGVFATAEDAPVVVPTKPTPTTDATTSAAAVNRRPVRDPELRVIPPTSMRITAGRRRPVPEPHDRGAGVARTHANA